MTESNKYEDNRSMAYAEACLKLWLFFFLLFTAFHADAQIPENNKSTEACFLNESIFNYPFGKSEQYPFKTERRRLDTFYPSNEKKIHHRSLVSWWK